MNYLICQDWTNTSNNHAGIKYLCNQLQTMYPSSYTSITIPDFTYTNSKYRIVTSIIFRIGQLRHKLYRHKLCHKLIKNLQTGDKIFLMEYMEKSMPMLDFAQQIKFYKPQIAIYGLVHLVPNRLTNNFPQNKQLYKWTTVVDKILTLGHSLTNYFISRGVDKSKIYTTFHYVDKYYCKKVPLQCHNDKVKVIAMGNQMRNISLLKKIVTDNPDVNFTICQGLYDMSSAFKDKKNVTLIPFVEENELRNKMAEADISLNVMADTIGSNVIVTSLAMGLAMICSDVGSIRDYCDETNTIFCNNNNITQFTNAISTISRDKKKLISMRYAAIAKSKLFTIERFEQELREL